MNRNREYLPKLIKALAMVLALCGMVAVQGSIAANPPERKKQAIYLIHGLSDKSALVYRWPPNFIALLDAKIDALGDDYRVFGLDYRQTLINDDNYNVISEELKLRERLNGNWNTVVRSAQNDAQASTNVTRLSNLIKQSMENDLTQDVEVNILGMSFGGFVARDYVVEHMNGLSHLESMTGSITFVDHPHLGSADLLKYYTANHWYLSHIDIDLQEAIDFACGDWVDGTLDCSDAGDLCGTTATLQCAAAKRLSLWNGWVNTNDNGYYPSIEWTNLYGAGPMEDPPSETVAAGNFTVNLPAGRTDDPGEDNFRSCTTSGGNSRVFALDGNCSSETSDFSSAHRVKEFDHNIELPFLSGEDHHGSGSTLRKKRSLRQLGLMHLYRFGDVTGDGAQDIVEFDDIGVRVHEALPPGVYDAEAEVPGFKPPVYWSDQFSFQRGWRYEQHPRYLVDINGDGAKDIVGFSNSGLFVAYSNAVAGTPDNSFSDIQGPICSNGNCWSADNGYKGDQHPRIVTNLGKDSSRIFLVYFTNANLSVGELVYDSTTGVRFEYRDNSNTMGFSGAWRAEKNPRILGDVSGDGWLDVVGFGQESVRVVTSNPAESSLQLLASNWYETSFTTNDGKWQVGQHPRVLGDVNGDGAEDIVGFAGDAVVVALSNGTGFSQASIWTNELAFNSGWRVDDVDNEERRRTDRFVEDANGDGMADVIAYYRQNDLRLYLSDGVQGFTRETDLSSYPQLQDPMYPAKAPLNYERFLLDVHGDGLLRVITVGAPGPQDPTHFLAIDRDGDGHADNAEVEAGSDPQDPDSIPLPPGCA